MTTEPVCETEGLKTFTCRNDEPHTRTEPVAATGHDWKLTETVIPPTCEADGEGMYTCQNDASHTQNGTIEKLGHVWDDGIVTKEPTADAEGEKIYTCQNDPTHTQPEAIEKLKPSGSGSSSADTENSDVPATGDETPIAMYIMIALLCVLSLGVILSRRKKTQN